MSKISGPLLVERLYPQIKHHEGTVKSGNRHVVYDDATGEPLRKGMTLVGHPTVGWGRNLAGNGLDDGEAEHLLQMDIRTTESRLVRDLPWTAELDEVRFCVLLDMALNMGINTLLDFAQTLAAVKDHKYHLASQLMLQSKWATQVGKRAKRLSRMMETGEWPNDV